MPPNASPVPSPTISQETVIRASVQTVEPVLHSSTENTHYLSYENHNLAGTSYRQKEIKSLGKYNIDYEQSRKELIDSYVCDEKIYEIIFSPNSIELVEEPENEYDSNAIKVIIDDIHVGYIKKGSCSHIKNLLTSNKIAKITADIHGGKYKYIYSEYDEEKMDDVICVKNENSNYFVSIQIYLAKKEQD